MKTASMGYFSMEMDISSLKVGDISTCLYADISNLVKGEISMVRKSITTGARSLSR